MLYSIILLAGFLPAVQTQGSAASSAQQSAITIHVFKSGLFSGFAHNHIVVAPIAQATVDPARMTADITVATKDMKVTDPEVSEKDRTEIQTTKFSEIRFKSSRIEQTTPQHYRVMGMLDLHGASKEIVLEVTGGPEHYHGATKLKQTDFGIKPISMGGGSIKVKDELQLEFDVYSAAPAKMGAANPSNR